MTHTELLLDLQQAARGAIACGKHEQAITHLEQLIGDGPTRLSAAHDLVRALRAAGRRTWG